MKQRNVEFEVRLQASLIFLVRSYETKLLQASSFSPGDLPKDFHSGLQIEFCPIQ
jgi:hypothetical protein